MPTEEKQPTKKTAWGKPLGDSPPRRDLPPAEEAGLGPVQKRTLARRAAKDKVWGRLPFSHSHRCDERCRAHVYYCGDGTWACPKYNPEVC